MKEFWHSISNKLKSVYVIWITFHFILFMLGESAHKHPYFNFDPKDKFWLIETFKSSYYDSSEFWIYTTIPILLYAAYWFSIKDSNKNSFFVKVLLSIVKGIKNFPKLISDRLKKLSKILVLYTNRIFKVLKKLIYFFIFYLPWMIFHFFMWKEAGFADFLAFKSFYPQPGCRENIYFNTSVCYSWFDPRYSYDFSELSIYLITPMFLLFLGYLIKKK